MLGNGRIRARDGDHVGLGGAEILIILGVIALLFGPGAVVLWFLLTQARASESPQQGERDPAYDAARERYARGEINRDEFEEIKHTLGY